MGIVGEDEKIDIPEILDVLFQFSKYYCYKCEFFLIFSYTCSAAYPAALPKSKS
jgi:hypothetical protein